MPTAPRQHRPPKPKTKRHGVTDRQKTREYNTGSKVWRAIRQEVLIRDNYTCTDCGKYGNQVDHIDGDSTNNPPDGSNLQTLCLPCHMRKTASEHAHSSPSKTG